jgi:hypothetical protein
MVVVLAVVVVVVVGKPSFEPIKVVMMVKVSYVSARLSKTHQNLNFFLKKSFKSNSSLLLSGLKSTIAIATHIL